MCRNFGKEEFANEWSFTALKEDLFRLLLTFVTGIRLNMRNYSWGQNDSLLERQLFPDLAEWL